jgi:hypothetical protein
MKRARPNFFYTRGWVIVLATLLAIPALLILLANIA